MTLPNLVADYEAKTIATKLKKVQSVMSQAVLSAQNQYGEIKHWGLEQDTKEAVEILGNNLKPYLKIIDDCGTGTCENYTGEWEFLNGRSENITDFSKDFYYKLRLADGTELFLRSMGDNFFTLFIDINGKKAPNVLGRDIFRLLYENNKIYANGVGEDPQGSTSTDDTKWAYCNPSIGQGWFCAAWIMYKENMDYLKCPDKLTWDGNSRCK